MTAEVRRLRPKRHDVIAESLQLALDMPLGLKPSTRDDLAEVLGRYQPSDRSWTYTMINGAQSRLVLKLIKAGPKPMLTLSVWEVARSHVMRHENGACEIMASRTRLAEDAETTPQEASRALSRLAEMGALIRLRPGRYAINPHVGWNGSQAQREAAAKDAPPLRVID